MDALKHLKSRLNGKVVVLGMGNILRSDDGIGSILASRIKDKVPYIVYDGGNIPENYLGKIVKEKPDNIVIIDAVDFDSQPGDFRVLESQDIKTTNLFFTHNASLSLVINYLQTNLEVNIITLIIQPKSIALEDKLSVEVNETLRKLESWFYENS